tara:strand:- start:410 stop:622 length:213 start_codon:yes stop_codon:yes gene_type:complete
MALDPSINRVTGQRRIIRKKGDLNGSGKGDWARIDLLDEKYKENYDKIFGKRNMFIENKLISKDESAKKH